MANSVQFGSCSHQKKCQVQVDEYDYAIISTYVDFTIFIIVTEKPFLGSANKIFISCGRIS